MGEVIQPTRGFDWWRLLPPYWIQNAPTDRVGDAALNKALDSYTPVPGYCVCDVGPFKVWAANWPYAYGSRYLGRSDEALPMVRTRKRLRRMFSASRDTISAEALAAALAKANGEPQA